MNIHTECNYRKVNIKKVYDDIHVLFETLNIEAHGNIISHVHQWIEEEAGVKISDLSEMHKINIHSRYLLNNVSGQIVNQNKTKWKKVL